MTKVRKDSQEPPTEKSPPSEKASQGKSSLVSNKNLSAMISDGLDINPPSPNTSRGPQKREGLASIRIDEAGAKSSPWLREFIKERLLEIDVPDPMPSETHSFPFSPTPTGRDSSRSQLQNPTNTEINRLFLDANRDTKPLNQNDLSVSTLLLEESEAPGDRFEGQREGQALTINQALLETDDTDLLFTTPNRTLKVKSDKLTGENDSAPESGGNGKREVALKELAPGLETRLDSGIDNEISLTHIGKEEAAAVPEVKPHRRAKWMITFLPLMMVVMVGAWALRDFISGNYTNIETDETAPQSLSMSLSMGEHDDELYSDEMSSMPVVLLPGITQKTTPDPSQYDRSVLTPIQKDRLYKASLNYLADDEEEAVYVARSIGYVPNEGHPATMCGPLAMSILRDAMLVDRYVDLGDFWLLNPRDKYTVQTILEKHFQREHYQWYQTSTPINHYNFKSYPLYTGDFLYLFAGPGGTFEHMLVVTRVDDMGRAYSVFAQEDSNGYSIREVMLYDPNNPGEGYFYEITDRANAEFGLTGFGGFWMWRRITPIPEANLDDLAFSDQLDAVLNETGGEWHVYIKEIGGRVIYARESQVVINPASVIKVPLAIQFFQALDRPQETDLVEYLSEHGVGGRTYMQLLSAMLVNSEEEATDVLQEWVEDRISVKDNFARWWGVIKTTYTPRRTTAEEISKILEGLYQGSSLSPEEKQIILDLMSEHTSGDDTRLGLLSEYLPDNYKLFNKRGSNAHRIVIVADVAIIEMGDRAYVVAMFGTPQLDDSGPTYEDLESAIEETVPFIWSYLNKQ